MMSTFSSKTALGERPQSAGSHFVWLSLGCDEGEEYEFGNIVEVCVCVQENDAGRKTVLVIKTQELARAQRSGKKGSRVRVKRKRVSTARLMSVAVYNKYLYHRILAPSSSRSPPRLCCCC